MSTSERIPETISRSTMFSTQEFMEFLNQQADDIAQLEVTVRTKSGLSASFTPSTGKDDVFKSLEVMKTFLSDDSTVKTISDVAGPSSSKDFWTSKEWSLEYARNHVDVTYNKCFTDGTTPRNPNFPITEASSLPPKKRTGKTDWNAMYNSALSPLIEAAARAQPQPIDETPAEQSHCMDSTTMSTTSKTVNEKKRKPRKVIPVQMDYVDEYTDKGR